MNYFYTILLFLFIFGFQITTFAKKPQKVPAKRNDSALFVQPNGRSLYLILHGDERKHFYTSTDGYLLIKNRKGFFCYAKMCCGKPVASYRKASNITERSKRDQRYLQKISKNSELHIY